MIPQESQPSPRLTPPDTFQTAVRDALLHLYDLAYLQTHPLLLAYPRDAAAREPGGKLLRRELLAAIEMLRPASGTPAMSRLWRLYHILELRYIAGEEVTAIMAQLSISKSEYHREHQRALAGIAALLRERWHVPPDWNPQNTIAPLSSAENNALLEDEVTRLHYTRRLSSFDPLVVVQDVLRLLSPLCEQRHVKVQTDFPPFLPALSGDQLLFRHALLIVLTHAISESMSLLELHLQVASNHVTLTVPGISGAQQDQVRAGIEECRPFLEKLAGQITIGQRGQLPSSFTIELSFPLRDCKRLLVVDNNADFVALVTRYLEETDWEVVGANSVEEALRLATLQQPHAVLLDVVIPDRDGWDCLQVLKQTPIIRHVPVIICSVLDEPGIATALGAAAYLLKPISSRQLLKVLATVTVPAASPAHP